MKRFNVLQSLVFLFLFSQFVFGAVPRLINFQGVLKTPADTVVSDGSYSVTFTIYDAPASGNVFWTETASVTTANGLFTVLLGSTNPVPDSVFHDTTRYLGIQVGADPEMTPRQRLSSVGYSSVSSQWTSAGQNLFTLSGKVGIGESNPLNTLTIGSNGAFTSTGLFPGILMGTTSFQTKQLIIGRDENNFVQLAYADEDPLPYARLLVEGNHPLYITTGGSMALVTQTNNPLELYTNSTSRMHITGDGNVGIGTTSPAKKLDVVGSIKTSDTLFASNVSSNSPLRLQTAGTTRMFINDANGNVGIGTTNPVTKLHVVGTASGAPASVLDPDGTCKFVLENDTHLRLNLVSKPNTAQLILFSDTATIEKGAIRFSHSNNTMSFITGGPGLDRMVINGNGNIGIGSTFPGASNLLELSSTTKGFVLPRMTKTERDAIASPVAGMMIYQTDNTPGLRVYNSTNWMRFTETAD